MRRIKSSPNTRHRKTFHHSPQITNVSQTNTPIRKLCGPRSSLGHVHDHVHRRTPYTTASLTPTFHLHQLPSQPTINSLTISPPTLTKNTIKPYQIEYPQKHPQTHPPPKYHTQTRRPSSRTYFTGYQYYVQYHSKVNKTGPRGCLTGNI